MSRHYLIQDPYHEYAARFIEHFYDKYGYRAICMYTDRQQRISHQPDFPVLRSERIAANYEVKLDQLTAFATHLRHHHDVAAVIPFNEPSVLAAAELAQLLDLDWAQPEVMRRCRDKLAFKEHLRQTRPALRINASQRVTTLAEVLASRQQSAYRRFVLKPNNGFGNRQIGLFDQDSAATTIEAYLRKLPGTPILMEEYIGGIEYFVNGQIDTAGAVTVIAIFKYVRTPANGRHNIDFETLRLPHADPLFAQLVDYTEQVMQASGLRRSPFHLELKVDERGPCLIEVGARLAGHSNAFLCNELHGSPLDLIDLAAHYYVQATDYGPPPLNWSAYDSHAVRYVHGVATQRERIYQLDGIGAIEALPEFHRWVKKPVLGAQLSTTVDSLSMPWSLIVKAPTELQAAQLAVDVRRMLHWNRSASVLRRATAETRGRLQHYAEAVRVRALLTMAPRQFITPALVLAMNSNNPLSTSAASGPTMAKINPATCPMVLLRRARSTLAHYVDALVRRMQILGIDKRGDEVPLIANGAGQSAQASMVVEWAQQYLARPHAQLSRKGPICPFVQHTIDLGRFMTSFHDEIDGTSIRKLRRVALDQAENFRQRYPQAGSKGSFASLILVFPMLPAEHFTMLERVHDQLKTYFMEHDLMFSPLHPECKKPSISNPDFEVFRAPFAGFAIRHMDVRDIAFLNLNQRAFEHYRTRFAGMFEQGKVSDEYGYVRLYEQACARFAAS